MSQWVPVFERCECLKNTKGNNFIKEEWGVNESILSNDFSFRYSWHFQLLSPFTISISEILLSQSECLVWAGNVYQGGFSIPMRVLNVTAQWEASLRIFPRINCCKCPAEVFLSLLTRTLGSLWSPKNS